MNSEAKTTVFSLIVDFGIRWWEFLWISRETCKTVQKKIELSYLNSANSLLLFRFFFFVYSSRTPQDELDSGSGISFGRKKFSSEIRSFVTLGKKNDHIYKSSFWNVFEMVYVVARFLQIKSKLSSLQKIVHNKILGLINFLNCGTQEIITLWQKD